MKLQKITGFIAKSLMVAAFALSELPGFADTQIASQLPADARIAKYGGGDSYDPIVTPGGRFVFFASTSDNLVTGPEGAALPEAVPAHVNVFKRDRLIGTTVLVSINAAGTAGGNGDSFPCAISANGQFAFFESAASDLIDGDTNGATDIFVRDTVNKITTLVSVGVGGAVGNAASRGASITPDGRYVAFVSAATNLVTLDTNGIPDVFVRDLKLGTTTMASVGAQKFTGASGTPLTQGSSSESPLISSDGRYVAFYSTALGLVSGVTNGGEIYLRNLVNDSTAWVSTNAHKINPSGISANYAMSTNGQWIAYQSMGGKLPGMVFRYNALTGTSDGIYTNAEVITSLDIESRDIDISANGLVVAFRGALSYGASYIGYWNANVRTAYLASGTTLTAQCDFPRIDSTGEFVAFTSDDPSLTPNSDGLAHIYRRDTFTDETVMIDVSANGTTPISSVMTPFHYNTDGTAIAFACPDGTMGGNPYKFDAFVRLIASDASQIISTPASMLPSATPLNPSELGSSSVSSNGQFVAYVSDSDSIVSGDTNRCPDVYVHDFASGSNMLASVSVNGVNSGNGNSREPSVSADGRFVAFSSSATNLVPGDTNLFQDVFVRDLQDNATILISKGATAGEGNGDSSSPQISSDGWRIMFYSTANNLTTNSGVSGRNVFLHDLHSGITFAITTNASKLTIGVAEAVMTPDGSNVLFALGPQLSLWNAQSQSVTNVAFAGSAGYPIIDVAISSDAHRASYATSISCHAVDLVSGTNWTLGALRATSHKHAQFSGDGRFLAYLQEDATTFNQVYLYDFQTATNTLVSQSYNSALAGNGMSDSPAISADGRFVAYRSAATNLVPDDINGVPDIFLYDRLTGGTTLLSVSEYGAWSANGRSTAPAFSDDGQTLFFESWASDLAAGDFNESSDVFAVSLGTNGSSTSTNAAPPPNFTEIAPGLMNGQFTTNQPLILTWPSVTGVGYQVQFKNNLTDPEWQPVGSPATVVGNQGSATDFSLTSEHRFYRIVSFWPQR